MSPTERQVLNDTIQKLRSGEILSIKQAPFPAMGNSGLTVAKAITNVQAISGGGITVESLLDAMKMIPKPPASFDKICMVDDKLYAFKETKFESFPRRFEASDRQLHVDPNYFRRHYVGEFIVNPPASHRIQNSKPTPAARPAPVVSSHSEVARSKGRVQRHVEI